MNMKIKFSKRLSRCLYLATRLSILNEVLIMCENGTTIEKIEDFINKVEVKTLSTRSKHGAF